MATSPLPSSALAMDLPMVSPAATLLGADIHAAAALGRVAVEGQHLDAAGHRLLDDGLDRLRLVDRDRDAVDLLGDQVLEDLDLGRALRVLRHHPLILARRRPWRRRPWRRCCSRRRTARRPSGSPRSMMSLASLAEPRRRRGSGSAASKSQRSKSVVSRLHDRFLVPDLVGCDDRRVAGPTSSIRCSRVLALTLLCCGCARRPG